MNNLVRAINLSFKPTGTNFKYGVCVGLVNLGICNVEFLTVDCGVVEFGVWIEA